MPNSVTAATAVHVGELITSSVLRCNCVWITVPEPGRRGTTHNTGYEGEGVPSSTDGAVESAKTGRWTNR
jgi:hypothetical protein